VIAGAAMSRASDARRDAAVSLLLFVTVVLYLAALPRNLGTADESYFLLEAKRIARGETLYRDLFYFAAPGAHWLMALIFRCFGVSLAVARLAMAVLHGATAVLLVLTCRTLAVRRGLALAAGVAYVALCQPVWPYASSHWLCTFLMVLLLFTVVRGRPWGSRRALAVVPGVIVGALAAVQQHAGAAMALGVGAFFLLDGLAGRRFGQPGAGATAARQILFGAAGGAAVVLPLAAGLLASIGITPLYRQLVEFPLENYRRYHPSVAWAGTGPLSMQWPPYTYLPFLTHLRIVIGIDAARAALHWLRRTDAAALEALLALVALCSASALSIVNFPDFIHVAYVAPLFLVAIAEGVEALVRPLEAAVQRPHVVGWILCAALLAVLVVHLQRNLQRARASFPIAADTAFGPVDFATQPEANIVQRVRDAMRDAPTRTFFAYPVYTSIYLTADVDNPTPYPAMVPGYNSPEQFADVIRALDATPPAYLLYCPFVGTPESDPVLHYIGDHYEYYAPGPVFCRMYRRRSTASGASR
jgi:hypothetical protein